MNRILIIFSTFLAACVQSGSKSSHKSLPINIGTVDRIELRNHSTQTDSLNVNFRLIEGEAAAAFVEHWNKAKSKGPCIFIPYYFIDVHFKYGIKRSFRVNGHSIKEGDDWCYDLGKDYELKMKKVE